MTLTGKILWQKNPIPRNEAKKKHVSNHIVIRKLENSAIIKKIQESMKKYLLLAMSVI